MNQVNVNRVNVSNDMCRFPIAVRIVAGFLLLLLQLVAQVGHMTDIDAKRKDYDDAYGNWAKQDISRGDLLKMATADAVQKIHNASELRNRVQKTRQDYLVTLRASYDKSAQDIDDNVKVAGFNVKAIREQYDSQIDSLSRERSTVEAELKSIENNNAAAATIYRGHLNQRKQAIEKLVLDLSQDRSSVSAVEGSPEKIDESRKLLKKNLGKLADSIGASSKTVDDAGNAWKTYYSSLEDDIKNQKTLAEQKQIQAEQAKQNQAELDRKRLADAERQRKADLEEKQRAAELDKQRLADAEKLRVANLEKQRLDDAGKSAERDKQQKQELAKQFQVLAGHWIYKNAFAPQPKRRVGGKYSEFSAKDVELDLDPDGSGNLHYAVQAGDSGIKPVDFVFHIDSRDGQRLVGSWKSDGASGYITIDAGTSIYIQWLPTFDPQKQFVPELGSATLHRP